MNKRLVGKVSIEFLRLSQFTHKGGTIGEVIRCLLGLGPVHSCIKGRMNEFVVPRALKASMEPVKNKFALRQVLN